MIVTYLDNSSFLFTQFYKDVLELGEMAKFGKLVIHIHAYISIITHILIQPTSMMWWSELYAVE